MLLHSIGLALLSCALIIHATPINKIEETSGDMGVETSGSEIENSGIETSGGEESGIDIIIAFNKKESSGIEKEEQFSGEESGASGFDEIIWIPADCPRLLNGNYRLSACSNRFLSCSNGLPFLMDCPAGLLYNAALDQCDWAHNIGCKGASGEELNDISGSGIEASGDFSGLTFELGIESSGAVREIIVDASGNVVSIIDASGDLEEESGSGSGLGSGEEVSFEVLVFTLVDCRLLSDGLYPLTACENKYISCRAGLPSIRHCFPGQFYSAVHQICEEPHKIGCTDDGDFSGSGDLIFIDSSFSGEFSGFSGEFSGFSGEFSGFSGEESGFGSGESSGEFSGMSGGDVIFYSTLDCSSLSNGNYPMAACSAQFLSCSNNLPFVMDCPSNLLYNWAIDACDWPANLGCDFEASGLDGSGSGDEQPSCTENNGSFPVGPCLPVFVKCVDGSRFEMSCESGQLFSEKDSICLPAAQLNCTAST